MVNVSKGLCVPFLTLSVIALGLFLGVLVFVSRECCLGRTSGPFCGTGFMNLSNAWLARLTHQSDSRCGFLQRLLPLGWHVLPCRKLGGQAVNRVWPSCFLAAEELRGLRQNSPRSLPRTFQTSFGPSRVLEQDLFVFFKMTPPAVQCILSQVSCEWNERVFLSVWRTFGFVSPVEVMVSIWFSSSKRVGKC